MDFDLDEAQTMLKTSAHDFLEKECPSRLVRDMLDDDKGYSPELWKKMADLGWVGLVFPEKYGGAGSNFLDLAVLLEEMGRALLPAPIIETIVLTGRPILAAGSEEQKQQFLPGIASGNLIMTLAFTEPDGGLEASDINVKATPSGDDYVINGTKLFIRYANVADYLLCVTRTRDGTDKEKGITLFLVDAKTAGISIEKLKSIMGDKLCAVTFNNVKVPGKNILGELDQGWSVMKRILDEGAIAHCAWMIGGARWVLDTCVNYAKERIQFERPIGSFQAIQHKCANMAVEVEGATSLTFYSAWAVVENEPDISLIASMDKAWCSDIYRHVTAEGIQVHGGVGFTWEYDIQLYFKQAKASEVAFGDADYHREKVANMLNF